MVRVGNPSSPGAAKHQKKQVNDINDARWSAWTPSDSIAFLERVLSPAATEFPASRPRKKSSGLKPGWSCVCLLFSLALAIHKSKWYLRKSLQPSHGLLPQGDSEASEPELTNAHSFSRSMKICGTAIPSCHSNPRRRLIKKKSAKSSDKNQIWPCCPTMSCLQVQNRRSGLAGCWLNRCFPLWPLEAGLKAQGMGGWPCNCYQKNCMVSREGLETVLLYQLYLGFPAFPFQSSLWFALATSNYIHIIFVYCLKFSCRFSLKSIPEVHPISGKRLPQRPRYQWRCPVLWVVDAAHPRPTRQPWEATRHQSRPCDQGSWLKSWSKIGII